MSIRAAQPTGSFSGSEPSRRTAKSSHASGFSAWLRNRTLALSGVQPTTWSGPGCHVSRLGSPPSAGTTKTSWLPSYSPVKAIHFPSGEKRGKYSVPGWDVRRRAMPPASPTTQRSSSAAKTMRVPLMSG